MNSLYASRSMKSASLYVYTAVIPLRDRRLELCKQIQMPLAALIKIMALCFTFLSLFPSLYFSVMSFEKSTPVDSREIAAHFAATLHGEAPAHQGKDYALLQDPVIHSERLDVIRRKKGYVIDMDGVIYHVSTSLHQKVCPTDLGVCVLGKQSAAGCQGVCRLFTSKQQKVYLFDQQLGPHPA